MDVCNVWWINAFCFCLKQSNMKSTPRIVTVAATQMSCSNDYDDNLRKADEMIRAASLKGAQIILLQELFHSLYFCQEQNSDHFELACEFSLQSDLLLHYSNLAKELNVVLPISYYERDNNMLYNSIAIIDANGELLGNYRKTHIPDGSGYQEKFYFSPGDTGFRVYDTMYAKIGVAICWDQWFPEAARAMALMGAEILFYPTAIGSEPQEPTLDSSKHWERAMVGHSACNLLPVVASNRVGKEIFPHSEITFYGSSFITDNTGEVKQRANQEDSDILVESFNLTEYQKYRQAWGVFRDRRPELYATLLTKDGHTKSI